MRRPHRTRAVVTVAVTTAGLATVGLVVAPASAGPVAPAPQTEHEGELEGARYRVVVPDDWNGTLILYSHGNFPSEFFEETPVPHLLANQEATEKQLTDRGYALAASLFQGGGLAFTAHTAVADQSRLLDWFEENVGEPSRTLSSGQSLGAATALKLAEAEPERIDGVLTVGGNVDLVGMYDSILDVNLATKVLLTDGTDADGDPIDLVHPADPLGSRTALFDALTAAAETPQGRARIALIASLHTVTGWYDVTGPRPDTLEGWIRGQSQWVIWAVTMGLGPTMRVDLEAKLGGNPSSTFDGDAHDFAHQLRRSGAAQLVRHAYAEAGLDLRADLAALADEPVIEAVPGARDTLVQLRPEGTTPSPVLTLHTTGDGGAPPSSVRSFGERVREVGDPADLRHLWVERGAHLTVSVAEELVAIETLDRRLDTGRWAALAPSLLDRAAWRIGADHFGIVDPVSGVSVHEPAFTRYQPPRQPRPSW